MSKPKFAGPYFDGNTATVQETQRLAYEMGGTTGMDPFCHPIIPSPTKQAAFVGDWNPNNAWASYALSPPAYNAWQAYEQFLKDRGNPKKHPPAA